MVMHKKKRSRHTYNEGARDLKTGSLLPERREKVEYLNLHNNFIMESQKSGLSEESRRHFENMHKEHLD